MAMDQLILHPVVLLLATWAIGTTALSVKSSTQRFFLIQLIVPIILTSTTTAIKYVRSPWAGLFSPVFFIYYAHLTALTWMTGSSSTAPDAKETTLPLFVRCRHGMALLCDWRRILHPPAVAKVPPFPYNATSSKSSFLFHHSMRFLVTYLILDALSITPPPDDRTPFSSERVPILYNLLINSEYATIKDDITARTIITMISWFNIYIMIECFTSFYFVLIVALNLVPFDTCRPMFGSVSGLSSVRDFWGVFWHQLMRFKFTTLAEHFVHDIAGISPSWTLVSRYAKIGGAFALSGIMHLIANAGSGMPWRDSGALRFFLMQAGAIMVEDSVRALRSRGKLGNGTILKEPSKLGRVLGYAWVWLWMVWTTPGWIYPAIYHNNGSRLIPYSILQRQWTS